MRDARLHGSGADHRIPKPDHRADIWSLCAVLYEVIVGAVPPRDGAFAETWAKVHLELRAIVERGLSEAPSARWRSMTELGEALAEWLVRAWRRRGLPRRFHCALGGCMHATIGTGAASSTPITSYKAAALDSPTSYYPDDLDPYTFRRIGSVCFYWRALASR